MKIWLVDAFTDKAFTGNPAGVCVVENDFPDSEVMQNIATEMNWSQTAFVLQEDDRNFVIRWFSPRDESPICGHATLAASHIIWQQGLSTSNQIYFKSKADRLTAVRKDGGWIEMDFPVKPVKHCQLPDFMLEALNIQDSSTASVTSVWMDENPQTIDDLIYIVQLTEPSMVKDLQPNLSVVERMPCRAIAVTASVADGESSSYDFVSRYFAPRFGIPEDPVCGSAHCRLVPLWSKFLKKEEFTARQLSPRGGVLKLRLDGGRVKIAGQAITVSVGSIRPIKNPD